MKTPLVKRSSRLSMEGDLLQKSEKKSTRRSLTPRSPPPKKKRLDTPPSSKVTSHQPERGTPGDGKLRGQQKGTSAKTKTPKNGEKKSPIKTRTFLSSKTTNPHCTLCKKPRKEKLKKCSQCELSYHLGHCLSMTDHHIRRARDMDEWLCPKCARCSECDGIIDDPTNVECHSCLKVWHGACFKGKHLGGQSYACRKCPGRIQHEQETPSSKPGSSKTTPTSADWRKGRPKIGPRKLPKGWVTVTDYFMHDTAPARPHIRPQESEAVEEIFASRDRVWDSFVDEDVKNRSHAKVEKSSPSKRMRGGSRSPEKKVVPPLPSLPNQKITAIEDCDLFEDCLKALRKEGSVLHPAASSCSGSGSDTAVGKWVYFGDGPKMKALYATPYASDVLQGEDIYVCSNCMYPTCHLDVYRLHLQTCAFFFPPGCEIYREGNLSFFEVDGAGRSAYCRNLCLLSKMFISSKTLHHEVETFFFYILTENSSRGCRPVAYFSKEKNPSKNNNLSCLLTLPGENRKGYGKLLIDMSYELSRLERKIGSPEHPLSDLGLFAYRGYWRSSILQHLRSLSNSQGTSIKSMALATRINPSDLVNQLLRDKLLTYVDGNYYIKTWKRAYKWPVSYIRRRVIDRTRLTWKPSYDVSDLDPNKINYYV